MRDSAKSDYPRRTQLSVRSILDLVATLLMIVAAGFLVWRAYDPGDRAEGSGSRAGSALEPLPAEPIVLEESRLHGDAAARVILIEYSDFQCPSCANFNRDTWPTLRDRYYATGKLQIAFRHFPLETIHPLARKAAEAAECANRVGKFWEMHDALFAKPTELETTDLLTRAREIGLNETQFNTCLSNAKGDRVEDDIASAQELGVRGTPTFFLGERLRDGRIQLSKGLVGARPTEEFVQAIEEIIAVTNSR